MGCGLGNGWIRLLVDGSEDMGEHGLAGRALADCLCGPRYGRLEERPGGGNSRGRLPDVGWDGHWLDCVLREEMKEAAYLCA